MDPIPQHLLEQIAFRNGCWLWAGMVRADRPSTFIQSRTVDVARLLYEHRERVLRPGEELAPTCAGGELCVCPDHQEVSKPAGQPRQSTKRTEPGLCKYGHAQTMSRSGKITCNKCGYARLKQWRQREKLKRGQQSVKDVTA